MSGDFDYEVLEAELDAYDAGRALGARELAAEFGCSAPTIRRARARLVREGLLIWANEGNVGGRARKNWYRPV